MFDTHFSTKKRQRQFKASVILLCFALFALILPSTAGKADDASSAGSFSAAKGLAKSVGQTAATFTFSNVDSKKNPEAKSNSLEKLDFVKNSSQTAAATSSAIATSSARPLQTGSITASTISSQLPSASSSSSAWSSSSQSSVQIHSSKASSSVIQKIVVSISSTTSSKASSSSVSSVSGDVNWLISRESAGNPNAENGDYLGIGQLTEASYEKYVGQTWAQVKGNYQLQLSAMQQYIANRYGSVSAAISFWTIHGWY
ncbi:hypothetical protein [Oenococcus sicerae]|uniref:aggregation-promoting factor C-terminal-like domain-containing protein n=1 Tax=Oenococcus sicerae TaxID=2203724 RepID=UPI00265B5B55|nr:hypothetical protein [Oenococcus sicerae]